MSDVLPDPAATPPQTAKIVNLPNALTVLRLLVVPVFAVLYPSVVLAREGDPRPLDRPPTGAPVEPEAAVAQVAERLERRLDHLRRDMPAAGSHDGPPAAEPRADERWY